MPGPNPDSGWANVQQASMAAIRFGDGRSGHERAPDQDSDDPGVTPPADSLASEPPGGALGQDRWTSAPTRCRSGEREDHPHHGPLTMPR